MFLLALVAVVSVLSVFIRAAPAAAATWTPLIASSDFDGIKADMLTTVGGLMMFLLIVLGLGLIYKVLTR